MTLTFFFYDLETSGFSPKNARIMQFGGQRTDLDLKPIGEPHNLLIKLTEDILPDPGAILITGITPQKTRADGISEAEFLKIFHAEIAIPGTIFVGYNNVRFDDEFMRYQHYRNFYDPYEWHWADGKSRWDLLDVVRLTRALRPAGLKWPFGSDGAASNRLELLTTINKIQHDQVHDALSDVNACIAIAKLIKEKQPKLFDYMLNMRDKQKVSALVYGGQPFVYSSGKYPSEFEKTTVVTTLAEHPKKQGALVYDLRHDPTPFIKMTPAELAEAWRYKTDESALKLPVKTLQFNRCPAVAPLVVLDKVSQERLKLDMKVIKTNQQKLGGAKGWVQKVIAATELMDEQRQATFITDERDVDARLYDGFFNPSDKQAMRVVRGATASELKDLKPEFKDDRLRALLPLYKARNYSQALSDEERGIWEGYREAKLLSGGDQSALAKYYRQLEEFSEQATVTKDQKYLLEELKLWANTINT